MLSSQQNKQYLSHCLLLILIPVSIVTLVFGHIEASKNYIFPKLNDQNFLNLHLNFLCIGDAFFLPVILICKITLPEQSKVSFSLLLSFGSL